MLSWSIINDDPHYGEEAATAAIDEGQASRETTEAREARHNAVYEQALALHGEGSPHSDAWARAKKLYDTVISDEPAEDKRSVSSFGTPVRFLCLKNLADMVEREGDEARALELQVAAADEDATDVAVWMKMARLSRAAGLSNLARLALERLLEVNGDHVLALRTLKDVLSEIGDVAACREVTKRLLNLDPYAGSGLSSVAAVEQPSPVPFHGPPATTASTRGEQQQQAGHPLPRPRWASPSRSSPPHCVERTLDLPSWERLGRLLIDTRACIVRGQRAAPPAAAAGTSAGAGELVPASASSSSAAVAPRHLPGRESGDGGSGGDVDVPSAAAAAAAAAAVSTAVPQPPLTLSTPVRIVLRLRDEAQAAAAAGADAPAGSASGLEGGEGGDAAVGGGGGGGGDRNGVEATTAAAGNDSHEHSEQEHHNQRRLRRPSVEKAMEWYSDGSSSSDDDDGDGEEEGGKGKGKGKLNGGRQSELRAERRTSARRQKQVEIREADVAAAREDDVEFRVASLFLTAEEASHDDKGDGGLGAAAAVDEEGEQQETEHAWWPKLARGAGRGARVDGSAAAEGGGACGDAGELEEEEVALAAKMLPRWKQRHDVDCRRCGEGGIVLCCDFCHLVYHPRCLEVTPGLTSLFACSDCKEEAAILEWELKGRDDAASGAVAGGLQELLRAADGRAGNAGVVDLMLRWLKGVTTAPPDDLCLEAAYCAADNRARGGGRGGGNGGGSQTTAGVPSGGYQLAAVALAVEPIVRGYLPTRFTWPALLAVGPPPATVDVAAPGDNDGPELGLACELALAEMHVDKALSLMRQRQLQQRPAGGSKSNGHSPAGVQPSAAPVGGANPPAAAEVTAAAAPAGTAGAAAPPAAAAAAAVVATDGAAAEVGGKKNEGAGGGGGGGCLRRSPEDLAREASEILADADRAMLQLEPWCLAIDNSNLCDDGDGAAEHGESNTAPWVLAVRWWWLKGIRARQGGQGEEALEHFHRCETALRGRGREQRTQQGGGASSGQEEEKGDEFNDEDAEEVAVLLPYCSVHPRIDLQVVRGLVTDVELSGTSEAAREAFSSAILLLSKCPAVRNADTAAGQRATVTAGTGTGATTEAARPGAASQRGANGKSGGTPGGGSSGGGGSGGSGGGGGSLAAAVTESRVDDAPNSQSVVSAESNPAGLVRHAPGGGQGNGERSLPSAAVDGTAQPGGTGGGVKASSPPQQQRDQALKALACVMRGLESRFVARAPSASPPFQGSISPPQSAAASAVAGGPGAPGVTTEPKSTAAAGNRGGWTARVLSSRAEELLSDLLEKEKAFLAQVNRDGARALERLAAELDKPNAAAAAAAAAAATSAPPPPPPPPFFLARTSPAPATPAIAVPSVLAQADGRSDVAAPRQTTAGPSSPPGTSTAAAVSDGERELLFRRRRQHVPLRLSGPGLGDQNSVFSMMLRGASLLGRHEIAVLLAVRCAEHFLDASDVLASPKGPLGIGGGGGGRRGSPAKRRAGAAGRSGSEGLGAVHLLLTSRPAGADRRAVDAAVTSATAEFLAHALAIVVWAVPYAARAELFGDGRGGGDGRREVAAAAAAAAAAARRASVLRCLARLMRHSMEDDNTRVLNLCVIAWQAIAAVAPVANNASTRTDTETGKPLPPEGRSAMEVEADLVQRPHDDEAGSVSTAGCGAFAAESVVRGLVRCLCGVVAGRWKQTAKARKKAWVLHAMEAVHALVRTLEYHQSVSCSNAMPATNNTNLTDSDSLIGPILSPGVSGVADGVSGVITPSAPVGANPARRSSSFFSNAGELRDLVKALMGLSNLPDGPTPATAAAAAAAATKGAGGAAGGGGGGGGGAGAGPPGGGLGVKLTCSLAVLVVGLSDAGSSLDAPRRVGLVETLHAHLKGKPGSAAVTLGGALEGRAGYGGVCADGEGVFLKTALLYLSSQQVASAVRKEDQERLSPGGENSDNDDVGLSRDAGGEDGNDDDDDGVEIDVEGTEDGGDSGGDGGGDGDGGGGSGSTKDREIERLTSYNGSPKHGDAEPASGGAGGSRGKGRRQPSKRAERLGERVLRALSQCQACLYDVAMVPCEDHRCLTPPSPPSTALEARALYVCWESRLPDLRRSHALRLLEAVAAHAAFSSPPKTRFSKAVETHVFLAWSPLATAGADLGAVEKDGRDVQGSSSRSSGGPGSRVLSFLLGTDSALPGGVFDNMPFASGGGNGGSAPAATGTTIAAAAASKDGTRDVNNDRSGALAVSAGTEREKRDTHEERRRPGTGRGDPQSAERWSGGPVDPEMEAFRRVYLGFYKNLVEAKGVPSGFRSCATKSIGDASDTEAALMQGIRWRVLDLSFCPDRMSSWKGLAQCSCRLAALYLDAFSPSCHRLGMPLMATAAPARKPMADSRAVGRGNPPRSPSTPGTKAGGEGVEAIDSSAAESPGSCPAAVAPGDTPSSNADAVMSDVVDAVDGGSSGVPDGSPAPGRKESGGGTGNGRGVGGDSPSNVTPPTPANDATIIEVAGTRNPEQAGLGGDDISNLVIDTGNGDTPAVADAAAPIAAGGTVSGSMDVSTGRGGAPSSLATAAAAGCATIAPRSTSMVTDDGRSGSGGGGGGGVDLLGKRRLSTAYTGLVIDTGDAVLPVDGSGARKQGRQGGGGSEKEAQRTASPPPFQALGLRGTPGPDLGPFFRGTSLDARAARKDGKGGGRRGGTRLAAIAEGLRRLGASGARTAAESAAAETMATRILGGSATHEEWTACLGHASIAAAVGAAEKGFSAWKALTEESLAKARREALRVGGKGGGGHEGGADGGGLDACETAARDLAECCEEEAFMKFMLARDVWPGAEPASTATASATTSTASAAGGAASVPAAGPAPSAAPTAPAARVPAGLEAGGRRRLLESSLSLLQRAQRLRETGGEGGGSSSSARSPSPPSTTSSSPRCRRPLSGSPVSSRPRSPKTLAREAFAVGGGGEQQDKSAARKRRKLFEASSSAGGGGGGGGGSAAAAFPHDSARVRGGGAGKEEKRNREAGKGPDEEEDKDEDDVLRWQVPFVMGRLCSQLGKDPRAVLEKLAEALRLAQGEHVPLEDELEALCRLHSARAELVLSGDSARFAAVASTVEAFPFREDDTDGDDEEGGSADFAPPPAIFSTSPSATPAAGGGGGGAPVGQGAKEEDISARRLSVLENCLDAFESCLDENKGQHTAIFAMANAMYRGVAIADDARLVLSSAEAMSLMVRNSQRGRAYGPQAALQTLKPLFEKRQQLLLAMSASDGVVGPGLALLSSRRRKLQALKRKYYALYIELLQATNNTGTLQGLLRRTKGVRETREEVVWVQRRVLRALLAILRSDIDSRAQKRLHGVAAAAAAFPSRGAGANPPPTLSTSPATAAAGAAAVTGDGKTSATAGPRTGTEAEVLRAVDNPGAAQLQARAMTGAAAAAAATGAVPAPVGQSKEVAAATPAAAAAAASGGGNAAKPGGDEKLALENAWNLYLQVVDLESTTRSGGGSSSSLRAGQSSSSGLTLLGDAEEVLVKSWQAFGAANAAVLELVELQNPLPSPGKGAGPDTGDGILLRRARACCHVFWPDKQGRGKMSKSKLKLKRPAAAAVALPLASSANRAAPRPKVQPRTTPPPASTGAAVVARDAVQQDKSTGGKGGKEARPDVATAGPAAPTPTP